MYCFFAPPPIHPPSPVVTSPAQPPVRLEHHRNMTPLNAIPVFAEDSAHCMGTNQLGSPETHRGHGNRGGNADASQKTCHGLVGNCRGAGKGGLRKDQDVYVMDSGDSLGPDLEATIVKFKHVVKKEGEMDLEDMALRYGSQDGELLGPVVTATVACCVWNLASFALMVYLFWKAHTDQEKDFESKIPWGLLGTIPLATIGALLCWAVRVEWKKVLAARSCESSRRDALMDIESSAVNTTVLELGPVR